MLTAVSIILFNKLLCLTKTYILYELHKQIGMTTAKKEVQFRVIICTFRTTSEIHIVVQKYAVRCHAIVNNEIVSTNKSK